MEKTIVETVEKVRKIRLKIKHRSADFPSGNSLKNSLAGMTYCVCPGRKLEKINHTICLHQNLLIQSINVIIGMVMADKIGDPLNLFG